MKDQDKTKEDLITELEEMRQRIAELEGSPVTLKPQETTLPLGIITDITCRKVAEEDLRIRDKAIKTSIIGIAFTTPDGTISFANDSWLRMLGFHEIDEAVGLHISELVPDKDVFSKQFATFLEQGYFLEEIQVRSKDGTILDVQISASSVLDDSGKPECIMAFFLDIADRKQTERALAESQERLDLALRGADLGLWDYNLLTGEAFISQRRAEMVGYSVDEIEPHISSWGSMVHPEDLERVVEAFDSHAKGETPFYECEHRLRHKSGEYIWVLARAKIVERDATGSPVRLTGTSLDITDRKRDEEALRKAKDELELRVQERTAELKTMNEELLREIAERKKAEEALKLEREQLLSIFDSINEVISVIDVETYKILYVNKFVESRYGEGIIGGLCYKELHGLDSPCGHCTKGIALSLRGEPYRWDYHNPTSNKDYLATDRIITWTDGRDAKFHLGIDVTERKRAAEALQESEKRYRDLVEKANDIIYLTDANGHFLLFNAVGLKITGYSQDEIVHKHYLDLIHPDYKEQVERFYGLQFVKRIPDTYYEVPIITHQGETVWIGQNVQLVMEGDTVVGFQAICRDITDRKRAEDELRASETKYRSLFEESKDAIYLTARDGALVDANQAFLDLFGFTREEAADMNVLKIYPDPADRSRFREKIEQSGSLEDYEVKFKKKDGTEIDCLLTFTLRLDKDGMILGYQGIARDITERKLLEKQLLQAQKMEAIGTLAGGIAHDFNNLLTIVMGFSELLLAEKDQKHPEYADLQKIFQAAKNGGDLVQRLLMFSRKSEPKPVPMDLNKQIVQVEKLLRRTIPKMIEVRLDLSSDLPRINADPSQIEQVLMNLAVNARDAMTDKGKLTVRTSLATLEEEYCRLNVEARPGEYVLLEMSDTGYGMDKETTARIFEPFFTTKEIGKGTGLGLAMVYGIVKQHNGHITVYSELGKGTTFRVYLPIIPSDVEPEVEDSGIMPAFGTETVLLVDDEEFVRELGARMLTKQGYTVLQADNSRKALDVFEKERSQISLVILDLIMPEMGGTECLKELLKIDPHVKVLVVSGYSADASVKETLQIGAKGFVSKPLRVKELLRDVRRVLDEK